MNHAQVFSGLSPPIILHRPSSANAMDAPDHPSGISTPPLQTSASVPFKWEQEPGKPIQFITRPEPGKCLDPPPCRMQFIANMDSANKITKMPSPSSILDGPYNLGQPRSSSFRFFIRDGKDSFETAAGALLGGNKGRGFFGKFKGGNREVDGGSFGISASSTRCCDSDESCRRRMENGGGRKMRRQASFSSVPHARSSRIWGVLTYPEKDLLDISSLSVKSRQHRCEQTKKKFSRVKRICSSFVFWS